MTNNLRLSAEDHQRLRQLRAEKPARPVPRQARPKVL